MEKKRYECHTCIHSNKNGRLVPGKETCEGCRSLLVTNKGNWEPKDAEAERGE